MRLSPVVLSPFLALWTTSLNKVFVDAACACKDVRNSFLAVRLWKIENPELTADDVINEFDNGFSQMARGMAGFQEYTGDATGNESTVFFFNLFDTEETAQVAQDSAAAFVAESDILKDGAIVPLQFHQATMDFHFASETCITGSIQGKYLSTRLWRLTEGSTLTVQDVVNEFEQGYAPTIQQAAGFLEYGGSAVTDSNMAFFYNVFETQEGATAANQGAADFVANGPLAGNIERVEFTEGLISFDYTCTEPPMRPLSDGECSCKDTGDSYLVTRLWDISEDSGLTPQDVLDEFDANFAPMVRSMSGFEEYLGATTGDGSSVFFFNVFQTAETAQAAQDAAVTFVGGSDVLSNDAITANEFTESIMGFQITSGECSTESATGKYLSTRLWQLAGDSSFSIQGVVDEFELGYGPIIKAADGFVEYGGAAVPGTNKIFFYNIFDTAEGAAAANAGAADFVTSSGLDGNIERVVFTEGAIDFDYNCVESPSSELTPGGAPGDDCTCKDVSDSYIVTRLWNVGEGLTPEQVIDEFDSGFAATVAGLEGFQEYAAAATGEDDTVFFFNIFESADTAKAAQDAAVSFVSSNEALDEDAITAAEFNEAGLSFHFSSAACVTASIEGKYLSTRLWKLTEGSTLTIPEVLDQFEQGYAPIIQQEDGFLEYGGTAVSGGTMAFFYNVFETEEGAVAANEGAASFVAGGDLNGNIERVVFTEGLVSFDYTCINPPTDSTEPETPPTGDDDCTCKDVSDSYIVTRLWNVGEGLTPEQVIDEFDSGFAATVAGLEGFQEYAAAATGEDDTVFFFNIFESADTAKAAQDAAVAFVSSNEALDEDAITAAEFNEAGLSFHFSSAACVTASIEGKYLSTRLWKLTEGSTLTIPEVLDQFEQGYAPIIQQEDGFLEYGGTAVSGGTMAFFYNVFETEEGAVAANEGAASFVAGGDLNGNIERVVFTEGLVSFDYTCINPPTDSTDQETSPTGDGSDTDAGSGTSVSLAALLVGVVSLFLSE